MRKRKGTLRSAARCPHRRAGARRSLSQQIKDNGKRNSVDMSKRLNPTASASKTLRFVYQGTRDGQPYSATREVALGVHARMTIGAQRHSISPQGTMRLTGRVGLAELPHGGAWVDLQVRDGSQWRTIDTRRTSAVGGWSYTHRMTRSQNTTFRFRARLRTSGDVAALPSTSPVTRVHVR